MKINKIQELLNQYNEYLPNGLRFSISKSGYYIVLENINKKTNNLESRILIVDIGTTVLNTDYLLFSRLSYKEKMQIYDLTYSIIQELLAYEGQKEEV